MKYILLMLLFLYGLSCTESATDYPNLLIKDIKRGKGKTAEKYDYVFVNYIGKLENGSIFDSSKIRFGGPHKYSLTSPTLIKGWRLGIIGMKEGGIRRLTIPPELAFGSQGKLGKIPPNAVVVFDIELVKVD